MFSKNPGEWFQTVAFRLTFIYMFLAITLSVVAFTIFYLNLTRILTGGVDRFLRIEMDEFTAYYKRHALEEVKLWVIEEAEGEGVNRVFVQLLTTEGNVICSSDLHSWAGVNSLQPGLPTLKTDHPVLQTLSIPGREYDVRTIFKKVNNKHVLQFSIALQETDLLKQKFKKLFGVVILLLTVCGGAAGWFVVNKAMSGVQRITNTASKIDKGDLYHRVPIGKEGLEIKKLANAFNDMLVRIQLLVVELKDVTNNIAHDLRTPITRIRGIAETTLTGSKDLADFKKMAGSVVEECDGLEELTNIMLDIAEIEAGANNTADRQIDFREIVRIAWEIFESVAEDKNILMTLNDSNEPLILKGNKQLLERVVSNLIDNALKYTPEGKTICLNLNGTANQIILSISDTGVGIDKKDLPHIAKKFYRADRSRSTAGYGLGLSLVKSIVSSHGGEISVESDLGKGTTFTVALPRLQTVS